jgi:ATP-dependent Clp protease ATP-binding subunit ClpA
MPQDDQEVYLRLSPGGRQALHRALFLAADHGVGRLTVGHLLLGLLQVLVPGVPSLVGPGSIVQDLSECVIAKLGGTSHADPWEGIRVAGDVDRVIAAAALVADKHNHREVQCEHMLLALYDAAHPETADCIRAAQIDRLQIVNAIASLR